MDGKWTHIWEWPIELVEMVLSKEIIGQLKLSQKEATSHLRRQFFGITSLQDLMTNIWYHKGSYLHTIGDTH